METAIIAIQNVFLGICQRKNFENRLIVTEVMNKKTNWLFFGTLCSIKYSHDHGRCCIKCGLTAIEAVSCKLSVMISLVVLAAALAGKISLHE